MDEILKLLRKFRDDRNWEQFHTPEALSKSILLEAAELLENYQFDHVETDIENVKEELADVMSYCLLLMDHYGLDFKEIMKNKIKKNEAKYPVSKAYGKSDKYNQL